MRIQWFPGHMHTARKHLSAVLSQVDVVLEVLDARLPFSSCNPMLSELYGSKLCVKAMLKSDLVEPHELAAWQTYFRTTSGCEVALASILQPQSIRELVTRGQRRYRSCGRRQKRLTMLVAGIPNVGKSSVINVLAGKAIANSGNHPALTRCQQAIELSADLRVLDTPGILWPNITNRNSGLRLAASGAIRDTAMSYTVVAEFLMQYLLEVYPRKLAERFGFNCLPAEQHAALVAVGQKRGCLKSAGQVDLERTAKLFVNEFRRGGLGKICLETPTMVERELAELAIIAPQTKRVRRKKSTLAYN